MPATGRGLSRAMGDVEAIGWLVGFDTTSAKPNRPLIDAVASYLAEHGAAVRQVPDETGDKANLFATFGPPGPGGIVLSGHSDVVPVDGQPWTSDPFAMVEREGRLYGRGTTDMKGFIGCALALAPRLGAAGLTRPVHIALSHDEEVGCIGVRSLIALIGDELPRPAFAIVGEPTGMRVVNAHKGISQQSTSVRGRDGHSSRPGEGVNAILFAAEYIREIEAIVASLPRDGVAAAFDPPGTTFNIGRIEGGAAVNIIARQCDFRWEMRPTPDVDPAEVLARLGAFAEDALVPRMRARRPESAPSSTSPRRRWGPSRDRRRKPSRSAAAGVPSIGAPDEFARRRGRAGAAHARSTRRPESAPSSTSPRRRWGPSRDRRRKPSRSA